MTTRVLFSLLLSFCGALLANSLIIQRENGGFASQQKLTLPFRAASHNLNPSLSESISKAKISDGRLLQKWLNLIPTNKPEDGQEKGILGSIIKNLNLNLIQRQPKAIPSHFPDEDDIQYTSDLQIFASLGIKAGSKIMAFIKSKIEGNRKMIFEHNYSQKKPYFLAENKFIIYSAQEFRQMYLTLIEPSEGTLDRNQQIPIISPINSVRKLQISPNNSTSIITTSVNDLTITVNWRTARKMTSVKFQQTCGACYSFTAIGAIESAYMITKNVTLNLAEQQVVDCSTNYNNIGCIGGWNANSYRYIQDFGVLHESDYPYRADFGNCNIRANPFKYSIKSFVEIANDCNQVVEALKSRPLSIAVNSQGWMYYSSGIYTDCKVGGSNHGVVLAGVDSTSWLVKNSGASHGEKTVICESVEPHQTMRAMSAGGPLTRLFELIASGYLCEALFDFFLSVYPRKLQLNT